MLNWKTRSYKTLYQPEQAIKNGVWQLTRYHLTMTIKIQIGLSAIASARSPEPGTWYPHLEGNYCVRIQNILNLPRPALEAFTLRALVLRDAAQRADVSNLPLDRRELSVTSLDSPRVEFRRSFVLSVLSGVVYWFSEVR